MGQVAKIERMLLGENGQASILEGLADHQEGNNHGQERPGLAEHVVENGENYLSGKTGLP